MQGRVKGQKESDPMIEAGTTIDYGMERVCLLRICTSSVIKLDGVRKGSQDRECCEGQETCFRLSRARV